MCSRTKVPAADRREERRTFDDDDDDDRTGDVTSDVDDDEDVTLSAIEWTPSLTIPSVAFDTGEGDGNDGNGEDSCFKDKSPPMTHDTYSPYVRPGTGHTSLPPVSLPTEMTVTLPFPIVEESE